MQRKNNTHAKPAESDSDKVLQAFHELLHNPETPGDLFNALAEFCCTQSNQCEDDLYHCEPVLAAILDSVPADDRRGAMLAARAEEDRRDASIAGGAAQ